MLVELLDQFRTIGKPARGDNQHVDHPQAGQRNADAGDLEKTQLAAVVAGHSGQLAVDHQRGTRADQRADTSQDRQIAKRNE